MSADFTLNYREFELELNRRCAASPHTPQNEIMFAMLNEALAKHKEFISRQKKR